MLLCVWVILSLFWTYVVAPHCDHVGITGWEDNSGSVLDLDSDSLFLFLRFHYMCWFDYNGNTGMHYSLVLETWILLLSCYIYFSPYPGEYGELHLNAKI